MAVIALLAAVAAPAHAALPAAQRQLLVDIYNSSNGAGWTDNTNWLVGDPCDNAWFGVTCKNANTQVRWLRLTQNNLTGTLPPSISALTGLEDFVVSGNQLSGGAPTVAGLSELGRYEISGNSFSGPHPSLAGLTALLYLNSDSNQLTGPIPSLAGLTALQSVYLFNNQLTGGIPDLSGLSALIYFEVFSNQLNGTIGPLVGAPLQRFRIENNQLTGPIPIAPSTLVPGQSRLCANNLTPAAGPPYSGNDQAWNAATGETPWSQNCAAVATFTVTPNAPSNGTISPNTPQAVASGSTVSFTLTPDPGYQIALVGGCGAGNLAGNVYTAGPITSDCNVGAAFQPITYTVTPVAGPNGSIAPNAPQFVAQGATVTFTLAPAAGYEVDQVSGCGGTRVGNSFTTAAASGNCTVNATFKLLAPAGTVQAIPTLGEWALALMVLLMATLGWHGMRTTRRPRR